MFKSKNWDKDNFVGPSHTQKSQENLAPDYDPPTRKKKKQSGSFNYKTSEKDLSGRWKNPQYDKNLDKIAENLYSNMKHRNVVNSDEKVKKSPE